MSFQHKVQGREHIPRRYQPKGFDILYEDDYIIVGNKAAGVLSVDAAWDRKATNVYYGLNAYVRKGNSRSRRCVYVVHRLDQHTSGVLVFAKSEAAQSFLKDHWKDTQKIYYAIVRGRLKAKQGVFESYLFEDDKYVVHSVEDSSRGKWAQTRYSVLKEAASFSLVRVELLTGRKNQIRVHFADAGHPLVGDGKYGPPNTRHPRLALHAYSISLLHPVTGQRMTFEASIPDFFTKLMGGLL